MKKMKTKRRMSKLRYVLMVIMGASGATIGGKYTLLTVIAVVTLAVTIYCVIHVYPPVAEFLSQYIDKTLSDVLVIVFLSLFIIVPVVLGMTRMNRGLSNIEMLDRGVDAVFGTLILGTIGYCIGWRITNKVVLVLCVLSSLFIIFGASATRLKTGSSSYKKSNDKSRDSYTY